MIPVPLFLLLIIPYPRRATENFARDCFFNEQDCAACCCHSQGVCKNQAVYASCCGHLTPKCFDTLEHLKLYGSAYCVQMEPVGEFGMVSSWTAFGWSVSSGRDVWIEFFMLRPIFVGWLTGYRTPIYKLVGRSGPALIDMFSGEVPVPQPSSIHVQPYDVMGWTITVAEGSLPDMFASPDTCGYNSTSAIICLRGEPCHFPTLNPRSHGLQCNDKAACPALQADFAVSSGKANLQPPAQIMRHFNASPYPVRASLDISRFVEATTSYEEFMTLRNRLNSSDLAIFEDKIRLRRELLPACGVPATPTLFMSNTDFNVLPYIVNLEHYVVKPSHMSNSDYVFVVVNGTNLNSEKNFEADRNKGSWTLKVTPELVQNTVYAFANDSAALWECTALVEHTRPGVIVEEAVLGFIPVIGDTWRENLFVNEYKLYTVWGEVVVAENVLSGTPYMTADSRIEIPRVIPHPKIRFQSVVPCYPEMVSRAELVAKYAKADFLRVDFLVRGHCEEVYLSEVELFPARHFTPDVMELMAEKWRLGYGIHDSYAPPFVSLRPRRSPEINFRAHPNKACNSLDLSNLVQPWWGFQDFMVHRLSLPEKGLHLFEDKIMLRQELLPAVGIQSTPSIFLSNVDFNITPFIRSLSSFVVKPSHLSASEHVLLIMHGFNILQHVSGDGSAFLSFSGVQSIVDTFVRRQTLESKDVGTRVLSIQPGVMVEELIMFEHFTGIRKINEYRFHVVWGEVVHSEMLFSGLPIRLFLDRAGQPLFLDDGLYTPCECDASSCIDCVAECYQDMVGLVEEFAQKVHADYIRVDVLIQGRCQNLYVSKCALFPRHLRQELEERIAQRWRSGYGFGQLE